MAFTIKKSDVYYISGKIIDINGSTFTISVTSPFTCEIKFHCSLGHYYLLHPLSSEYNWRGLQDAHPDVTEAAAYYNTEEKCFYKKESGTESEWKLEDFEDIYYDNRNLENPNLFEEDSERWLAKYFFFYFRYCSILHKEQLCEFSAYALDENRSVQKPQVERHPNDYHWIYDPDSFEAKKWDTESIDDLVREIRPSRECLNQLLESYKDDDSKAKKENWKKRWQGVKSAPKRLQNWFAEYDKLMIAIITLVSGAVGAELIKAIISILTSSSTD